MRATRPAPLQPALAAGSTAASFSSMHAGDDPVAAESARADGDASRECLRLTLLQPQPQRQQTVSASATTAAAPSSSAALSARLHTLRRRFDSMRRTNAVGAAHLAPLIAVEAQPASATAAATSAGAHAAGQIVVVEHAWSESLEECREEVGASLPLLRSIAHAMLLALRALHGAGVLQGPWRLRDIMRDDRGRWVLGGSFVNNVAAHSSESQQLGSRSHSSELPLAHSASSASSRADGPLPVEASKSDLCGLGIVLLTLMRGSTPLPPEESSREGEERNERCTGCNPRLASKTPSLCAACWFNLSTLRPPPRHHAAQPSAASSKAWASFVDLLSGLHRNPASKMSTAAEALRHPFFHWLTEAQPLPAPSSSSPYDLLYSDPAFSVDDIYECWVQSLGRGGVWAWVAENQSTRSASSGDANDSCFLPLDPLRIQLDAIVAQQEQAAVELLCRELDAEAESTSTNRREDWKRAAGASSASSAPPPPPPPSPLQASLTTLVAARQLLALNPDPLARDALGALAQGMVQSRYGSLSPASVAAVSPHSGPWTPSLRRSLWPAMLGVAPAHGLGWTIRAECSLLSMAPHPEAKQIAKDCARIAPELGACFAERGVQERVQRIIEVFLSQHPERRYWQGLHEVCAAVVALYPAPEDTSLAYAVFDALASKSFLRELHTADNAAALQRQMGHIDALLAALDHALHRRLTVDLQCSVDLFCIPWLLTAWAHSLPLESLWRVWDVLIAAGAQPVDDSNQDGAATSAQSEYRTWLLLPVFALHVMRDFFLAESIDGAPQSFQLALLELLQRMHKIDVDEWLRTLVTLQGASEAVWKRLQL